MMNEKRDAAEWRVDPLAIARYRWWDGASWTSFTSEDGASAPGQTAAAARSERLASRSDDIPVTPAPAAVATRGPWPASIPSAPARRPATLEEAATGVLVERSEWLSDDIDWSRLVLRLKGALDAIDEDLIEVTAGDLPKLLIDVAQQSFWWDVDLATVPPRVPSLTIANVDRYTVGSLPPGRELDPLLWALARASFEGGMAPWMRPGDRYKLHRWPNLTTLPHEPHHLRAISLLGQASLTAVEFASVADLDQAEADQLLTTFDLMGLLRVQPHQPQSAQAPAFVMPARQKAAGGGGLFGKLLSFFGR